jgi:MerR family transcriptional regulator, thiopeptide resistance regulator
VGQLSRAAGVTVRTLHHYDRIGLLVPSQRTLAGYRLYSEDDVRRLYAILALRRLGLSLDATAATLDGGLELAAIVRRQLEVVERQHDELVRLRQLLLGLRDALTRESDPSVNQLMTIMEAISVHERYLSADQLERLKQRGAELGAEAIEDAQREWADLFDALRAEMKAGTDPTDPKLDAYHERARRLLRAFTGGDADIGEAMRRMWENEDPAQISQGVVDRELWEYGAKVSEARGGML